MSECEPAFLQAETRVRFAVTRANGTVSYFEVVDGENVPITEEEYRS